MDGRVGVFRRYWRSFRDPDLAGWKKGLRALVGLSVLALIPTLALVIYILTLIPSTPTALELGRAAEARPSIVLAAGGEKLTQFEDPFHEWVPLDSIPPHVIHALLATEDRAFYEHNGIHLRRTVAAVYRTILGDTQGGSTLTQQLASNLFPEEIGSQGFVERKLKKMIAALKIEGRHTKRAILEAYLNTVPFIYTANGIERAARTYFGKPASQLSIAEGATLVGMLKGTMYYDPVRYPERARQRRNLVLGLMVEEAYLSSAEAARLQATALGLRFQRLPGHESLAPHFTAAVRARVEAWARARGLILERDGLVIRTTLDLPLQREAEAAVRAQGDRLQAIADVEWSRRGMPSLSGGPDAYVRYRDRIEPFGYFWRSRGSVVERHARRSAAFDRLLDSGLAEAEALDSLVRNDAFMDSLRAVATRLEAGFTALDPKTGDVKAYVGSRDFSVDEYDHVSVARRQPGSTFKPFVYAAALQRGYSPLDRITDQAVAVDLGNGQTWRPTNSGSISGADLTLADALAYSKNTITVQLMDEIGPGRVALVARQMGITESDLDLVPSLALGTSPVTLLEMVSAYGTIANQGQRHAPRLVTRIESATGVVLETFGSRGTQVLTRREAQTLTDMLRGVVDRGTGRGIRSWGVTGDVAGKTGTTQRNADGWFLLMHPRLVMGAWVGFNDQQITFRSNYWGQGAHNALFVVGDFFGDVEPRFGDVRFPDPPRYRQPFDDESYADSILTALDAYFERDSVGEPDPAMIQPVELGEGGSDEMLARPEEERPDLRPLPARERPRDRNAREDDFMSAEEMLGIDEGDDGDG